MYSGGTLNTDRFEFTLGQTSPFLFSLGHLVFTFGTVKSNINTDIGGKKKSKWYISSDKMQGSDINSYRTKPAPTAWPSHIIYKKDVKWRRESTYSKWFAYEHKRRSLTVSF